MLHVFYGAAAPIEMSTLSLHDALPISRAPTARRAGADYCRRRHSEKTPRSAWRQRGAGRSEEHTSELQSPDHLVCRLLLEKKQEALGRLDLEPARGRAGSDGITDQQSA